MNSWDKYVFIYKDAFNTWNETINPVFIAKHKNCEAILKEKILKEYGSIKA